MLTPARPSASATSASPGPVRDAAPELMEGAAAISVSITRGGAAGPLCQAVTAARSPMRSRSAASVARGHRVSSAATASRLPAKMSPGWGVGSRHPGGVPEARPEHGRCSASSLRAVAACSPGRWRRTCGRWLIVAIRPWSVSASIACGRAPSSRRRAGRGRRACPPIERSGSDTSGRPRRGPPARLDPGVSAPARGCPPTKRCPTPRAAITSRFTEPTSVTAHLAAASSASRGEPRAAPATGARRSELGALDRRGDRGRVRESIAPSSAGPSSSSPSGSKPATSASAEPAASPIDPPIRPDAEDGDPHRGPGLAPLTDRRGEPVEGQHRRRPSPCRRR